MEKQAISNNNAFTVDQARNVDQASNINQASNIQDALVIDEASLVDGPKKKKKKGKEKGDHSTFNIDLSAQDMIEAIIAAMGETISWGTGKVFEGADRAINGRFGLASLLARGIETADEKLFNGSKDGKAKEAPIQAKGQKEGGNIYNPSAKEMQAEKDPLKRFQDRTKEVQTALNKASSGKELSDNEKSTMGLLAGRFAKDSNREAKANPDASKAYGDLSSTFGKLSEGQPLSKDELKIVSRYAKEFDKKTAEVTKKVEKEVSAKKEKPKNLKEATAKQKEVDSKAKENKKDISSNKVKKAEVKKDIKKNLARKSKLQELSGRKISKTKTKTKTTTKTRTQDMALIKNKSQGR